MGDPRDPMFFLLGWLWFAVKRSKDPFKTGSSTGFRGVGIGAVWLQHSHLHFQLPSL